jgi:thioesterase domain-containing protein/acyl carrier protein
LVSYYLSKNKYISKAEIEKELQVNLPSVMIPKTFIKMDEWPLLISGKIDRKNLPTIESNVNANYVASKSNLAKSSIELRLAKLWEENLFIKNIDIYQDYFLLGGDSLSAMTLFLEIEREFKINLPISMLLMGSTIREQAKILSRGEKEFYWDPLIPVQIQGTLPPIFCIAGYGGNPLSFRTFSEYFGKNQPIYFLQSKGLNGIAVMDETIEEIAKNFLAEIKRVLPIGPYRFVGQSMGGKVAFEIAQQLLREGNKVDLLVLLDTYGNNYLLGENRDEDYIGNLKRLAKISNKHLYNLKNLKFSQYKKYFKYYFDAIPHYFRRTREKKHLIQKTNHYSKKNSVSLSNILASNNYIAKNYSGNVLLFRAKNQPLNVRDDNTMGWGEVVKGSLDIIDVNGYHGGMLFEPWVGKIARVILEKIFFLTK